MTDHPHIIILILDTLRTHNMSGYGYPKITSPHLDALAAEGVLFQRAFSAATWTVPSHASLLSGLYISQHRLESIQGTRRFNEKIVPLPKALHGQGYKTAAFSQNMLFSPDNHLEEGFDEFHDVEELLASRPFTKIVQRLSGGSRNSVRLVSRYVRKMIAPRLLLDNLFDWIVSNHGKQPYFVMANVLAPHFPWTLPLQYLPRGEAFHLKYLLKPEYVTLKKQWEFNSGKRPVTQKHQEVWASLYDASIRHVDSEVGRFVERLRKVDGWENTILVVTSDHGEMLGDYRGIVGHMLCLHDNLIHVPLILRHPGYPKGLRVEGVVQTMDLYPSVLEWAGVPTREIPAAQLQRPSLSQAVADPENPSGMAFSEEDYTDSYDLPKKLIEVNPEMDPGRYPGQQIAIRTANYKYIWYNDRPPELFDMEKNLPEEVDLLKGGDAQVKARAEGLQAVLDEWRNGLQLFPPRQLAISKDIDPIVIERLRALGYVP
jgi:arylsulfatase A-like enzyme